MAKLFGKGRSTITEHIQHLFDEGELDEQVVCRNFRHTTQHGAMIGKTQSKDVKYYNLDVIISVGYRVKSLQGTQFRIWATQRIKEYIIKGFALNSERFSVILVQKQNKQLLNEELIFRDFLKDFTQRKFFKRSLRMIKRRTAPI
jgi:hypothetical protein